MNTQIPDALPSPHVGLGRAEGEAPKTHGRIVCVAFISPKNAPLYLRTYNSVEGAPGTPVRPLRQTYEVLYNALDIVEERLRPSAARGLGRSGSGGKSTTSTGLASDDGFLGCLAVVGATALYGAVTHTQYRIVLAVRGAADGESVATSVRSAVRRLRDALVDALLNPLRVRDGPLRGRGLDAAVDEVVAAFA